MKIKQEKHGMQPAVPATEEKTISARFVALTREESGAVSGGYPWIPGWLDENPFSECGFTDCVS